MNELNLREEELDDAIKESEVNDFKRAFADNKTHQQACYDIATHFINKYHVKTIGGEKVRELFIYQDGIYIDGVNVLRFELRDILEELCTTHSVNEIIETVKDRTLADRKGFNPDPHLINLNNGVFDIRTDTLMPHDSKFLFFTKIPADYKKDADCPVIKSFLKETLDEEMLPVIQEWFGFGLFRQYFLKKGIIFVGEKNTGKTTLLRVIEKLFGIENISGVSLQKISKDKFATASLYNKHLNTYDDLPLHDIKDNGNFKMVTGGGTIDGEFKFKNRFKFVNYAKLMFTCNNIPDVKETNDDAYFDRWIVVPFNKVVDTEKLDPFLVEKMTTPEELSGLLNFSLEGLRRLLTNQRFSYDKDADEIKIEMLRSGSMIANFAYDCLEEWNDGRIAKEVMHKAYNFYAREHKLPSATMKIVGKIPKYATYISEDRPMDQKTGKQATVMVWSNVRFKSDFEFKDDLHDVNTMRKEKANDEDPKPLSLNL